MNQQLPQPPTVFVLIARRDGTLFLLADREEDAPATLWTEDQAQHLAREIGVPGIEVFEAIPGECGFYPGDWEAEEEAEREKVLADIARRNALPPPHSLGCLVVAPKEEALWSVSQAGGAPAVMPLPYAIVLIEQLRVHGVRAQYLELACRCGRVQAGKERHRPKPTAEIRN